MTFGFSVYSQTSNRFFKVLMLSKTRYCNIFPTKKSRKRGVDKSDRNTSRSYVDGFLKTEAPEVKLQYIPLTASFFVSDRRNGS